MIVASIDPGKKGIAVAVCSSSSRSFFYRLAFDKAGDLVTGGLIAFLNAARPAIMVLEQVKALHGSGSTQTFNFGKVVGQVGATVACWRGEILAGCQLHMVSPQRWQKVMHAGIPDGLDAKARSLLAYERLFPHGPIKLGPRAKKLDDNLIDALLMAGWGVQELAKAPLQPWVLKEVP